MLKAPYKDRPSKSILQIRKEKPFHYKNPKESLFYKERMAIVKTMTRMGGTGKKLKMRTDKRKRERQQKGIIKWVGKSIKEAKKTRQEAKNIGCITYTPGQKHSVK